MLANGRGVLQISYPKSGDSDPVGEYCCKRYEKARKVWDMWASLWSDAYKYILPGRESFYGGTIGANNTADVYDTTAVIDVQEFASKIVGTMFPTFQRWADFRAGRAVPKEEKEEIDQLLSVVTDYVFEVINNSNFYGEMHESMIECSIGCGTLVAEDGDINQLINFSAIPLNQIIVDTGPAGVIDAWFRNREMTATELAVEFPEAMLPEDEFKRLQSDPKATIKLVDCVYRDWSVIRDHFYRRCLVLPDKKACIWEFDYEGLGSNPYISFRWSKASGEIYSRGPSINVLSSVKTLNAVHELVLTNAEYAITGLWQYDDNGLFNPDNISLEPGTFIPRRPNTKGVEQLVSGANFNVADLVIEKMQQNIHKGYYVDQFAPVDQTPMSATEVTLRQRDLAQRIGSAWGRLHFEAAVPVLQRVVYLLKKAGRIKLPRLDGREVKIMPISPLARSQQLEDVSAIDNWLLQLQTRFGPEALNMIVKQEETARTLADLHGVPPTLVRTIAEQKQIAQAIASMQAADAGGGNGLSAPAPADAAA